MDPNSSFDFIMQIKSRGDEINTHPISQELKTIIEKDIKDKEGIPDESVISELGAWLKKVKVALSSSDLTITDYLKRLKIFSNQDDESYMNSLIKLLGCVIKSNHSAKDDATAIIKGNQIGPIAIITPELGRWSTVGGLGVMVDELSQGLDAIGQEIIMISPYYNQNRKGATDYLAKDPYMTIKFLQVIEVNLNNEIFKFGVHYGYKNNIRYFFLHNPYAFPRPYPNGDNEYIMKQMVLFARASLELLCWAAIIPEIILTNDWFTGLVAAYGKNGTFGDVFNNTCFFHICHNLQEKYEGRLYQPVGDTNALNYIHHLPNDWLVDPYWAQKNIINPSRCAIIKSDQWGTVSNSYKQELINSSPLKGILCQKPQPFSYPNGIFKENRLKIIKEKTEGMSREECKHYIQKKYFGYEKGDNSVPVFSFVGRITEQKGVLMILDAAEDMIKATNKKINILVGGMGDPNDPYCASCVRKINELKGKYPYCFWADPKEFFTDGAKVNVGSDFGLMPSLFEPGGIVQHEFFVAGTPVIAFRTGGLKDTVFEFNWDNKTGNGFTFDYYNVNELVKAMMRAIDLFNNKPLFVECRKNAYNSAIDVAKVSLEWCKEFYRLRGKMYYNRKEAAKNGVQRSLRKGSVDELNIEPSKANVVGVDDKNAYIDSHDFVNFDLDKENDSGDKYCLFELRDKDKTYKDVSISFSLTNWLIKVPMVYDKETNRWKCVLLLGKGEYNYRYFVDGKWMVDEKVAVKSMNDMDINIVKVA